MIKLRKNIIILLSVITCVFAGFFIVNTKNNVNAETLSEYEIYKKELEDFNACSISSEFIEYETQASASDTYYCTRDYQMFVVNNQYTFGLCWAFAGMSSLELTIAKQTGILYDFSEAWIAVCRKVETNSYEIGDGGTFGGCFNVAEKYGLLLEEQFPYEMLFNVDNSNYLEIFNHYKQFADFEIMDSVQSTSFIIKDVEKRIVSMKNHIINYGGLYTGINWNDKITYNGHTCIYSDGTSEWAGHAITIVGWDDDITFYDKNNMLHEGAFIAVNSHGSKSNEIIYIAYDDIEVLTGTHGYTFDTSEVDFAIEITESNSNFKNFESGQFKQNPSTPKTTYFNEKNVYYYGENIDITYSYNINEKYNNAQLRANMLFDNINCNNLFDIDVNTDNCTIDISNLSTIDSGIYMLCIELDLYNDGIYEQKTYTPLTVFSGAEMANISNIASNSVNQKFNTILSMENNANIIVGYTFQNQVTYSFSPGTYNKVVSITSGEDVKINLNNFKSATETTYAAKSFTINITNLLDNKKYSHYIDLTLLGGKTVRINIESYRLSDEDQAATIFNLSNIKANYQMHVAIGENYDEIELNDLVKPNYLFQGYYKDVNFTNKYENNIIKSSDFTTVIGTNNSNKNDTINFTIVYIKWSNITHLNFDSYTITDDLCYGDELNHTVIKCIGGSGNYTYEIISSVLPNGVNFNINTLTFTGNCLNVGDYYIEISASDNVYDLEATATINFTVEKRKITWTIDDKHSVQNTPMQLFTGSITEGSLYSESDNLNIQYICQATPNSPVGSYDINAIYNNPYYDITFINATYRITYAQIEAELTGFEGEYDGQYHRVKINVLNNIDDYKIEFSTTGEKYNSTCLKFKNCTDGAVTIYVKISAENYSEFYGTSVINIKPRNITITWTNANFVYSGNEYFPEYTVSGLLNNSDITLIENGKQTKAGNYTANITVSQYNKNYNLINATTDFIINKAQTHLEPIEINIEDVKSVSSLHEIELPQGYVWKDDVELKKGKHYYAATYIPQDPLNFEIQDDIMVLIEYGKADIPIGLLITVIAILILIVVAILIAIIPKIRKKVLNKKKVNPILHKNPQPVTIKFVTNTINSLPSIQTMQYIKIDLPTPERQYFVFKGWYTDIVCKKPYENNGKKSVLILYAKWEIERN